MARAWLLLLGLSALGYCQIIYPDQYEKMKASYQPNIESTQHIQQNIQQNIQQFTAAAQAAPYNPSTTFTTSTSGPQLSSQDWAIRANNIIARSVAKFTLDLDRAIYNSRGTSADSHRQNTVFSPLSISTVLAMVLLGSAGTTFNEVSRVLGLQTGIDISQHSEIVHQMFGALLNSMSYRSEENSPRVSSASGIFVQEGFPILPQFQAISQDAYKSEVLNLDFRTRGIEAMNTINNWVNQKTMGKISSILPEPPHSITNVILVSALYFNGEWNQHFINMATKRRQFFVEPNEQVEVDMMFNGGPFPFYEDKSLGVKMVQLPYKGMEMSMYVLLPKAEGAAALRSFSNQLTVETIDHLINNLKNETCIIGLPRMKLSSSLDLKNALQYLGLHSLFDQRSADLSLLSGGYGSQPVTATTTRPYVIPQGVLPQTVRPLKNPQVIQTTPSRVTPSPQALPQPLPQAARQPSPQPLPQAAPQPFPQSLPQAAPQPFPQSLPQAAPRPFPQSLPQAAPQSFPQSLPQGLPQTVQRPLPQSLPQATPRPIPQSLPENASRALSEDSRLALSQVLSQAVPQPLQIANPNPKSMNNFNDYLIFSRFGHGGNEAAGVGPRRYYFRYEDNHRGLNVEQWATGFHINKIHRIRRDNGRDGDASRLTYTAGETNDDLRRGDASDNTRYVSLEKNKYRFQKAGEQKPAKRRTRQATRPIDQNFLNFIQRQNLPSYGLDNLRNNGQLTNPGLFATAVLHKVEMDVTERGTEAAAATAVSLQRDGNQKRLIASRPFLFFIRHDRTGLILFWGTINTPTPNFAAVR